VASPHASRPRRTASSPSPTTRRSIVSATASRSPSAASRIATHRHALRPMRHHLLRRHHPRRHRHPPARPMSPEPSTQVPVKQTLETATTLPCSTFMRRLLQSLRVPGCFWCVFAWKACEGAGRAPPRPIIRRELAPDCSTCLGSIPFRSRTGVAFGWESAMIANASRALPCVMLSRSRPLAAWRCGRDQGDPAPAPNPDRQRDGLVP